MIIGMNTIRRIIIKITMIMIMLTIFFVVH